jgi:hypothetical protein
MLFWRGYAGMTPLPAARERREKQFSALDGSLVQARDLRLESGETLV